jgi:hypothetical protein
MNGTARYALNWLHLRWQKHVIYPIFRRLYRDSEPDFNRSIFVAGTARSGTTWLGDIISSQLPCRVMFEPFHNKNVEAYRRFNYFQYMRPDAPNSALRNYCEVVFTGRIRHGWIDRQVTHLRPSYRLIKEIRANLFLKWAKNQFPDIPVVFVIRHPCAVVLSRLQLEWATDADLEPLLAQQELTDDFLADKLDCIRNARSDEAKHALVWCISNLVPLMQFRPHELTIVYYEHLCTEPQTEMSRLFHAIGYSYRPSIYRRLKTPAWTTKHSSAVMRAEDSVTHWRRQLSANQISTILSVVKDFGLDYLYGDSLLPLEAINRTHATKWQ